MKITIMHFSAPPIVGGVESVIAHQARQMIQAGHEVKLLAGRGETWDNRIPVEILPLMDSRHARVLKIKESLDEGIVPDAFAEMVSKIRAELEDALGDCDVVIAHNVASLHKNLALTAALHEFHLACKGSPRLILWHHDLAWGAVRYENELHPGYPWDLLRKPWPNVKQVTISDARRQELADLFEIPLTSIQVVPAGIDLPSFLYLQPRTAAIMQSIHLEQATPVLLAPVRLTRRKNLELSLSVLAVLMHKMPQAALVITGPPGAHNPTNIDYMRQLQKQRLDLGLEGHVHILAEYVPEGLSDASVADFYRLADALFLPSRDEGFGIPILEAALARLPIFCSDLEPLRALAGEWADYFSPDDKPSKIAGLIFQRLKDDPVFRLRVQIRQSYTWEAVYRRQIAPLLNP
ncbi:MAG: glycosyltransferase family 4 protein [Anaerolineaceae bacterium]